MPADARSELHAPAPAPALVTPTAATTPIDRADDPHQVDVEADAEAGWWWVTAAGMTAAGVAAALARQRRIWLRRRGYGRALPDVADATVAAAVRPAHTEDARSRTCLAVRAFAAKVHDVAIAGVTIDVDGTIALLLDHAAPEQLPDGWYHDAFDDRAVELPPHIPDKALQALAATTTAAAATLVSVGVGNRTGQLLMIALESAGSVALDGPAEVVEQTMLAWALELASSEHAAALDVWLVGFDMATTARASEWERIHCAASATEGIAAVRSQALGGDPHDLPSRGDDDWVPQVIVCHPGLAAAPLRAVHEFADDHRGAGVIAVTAGDHSAAGWRLAISADTIMITSLQQPVALRPVKRISREEFTAIVGAVAAAKRAAQDTLREPAEPERSNTMELLERLTVQNGPPHDSDVLPDALVIVRLLGPVTVETPTATPVPPGRITEAIAYLACHRDAPGVSTDRLIDVLWGGRAVQRQRLAEIISRARQAIGGTDRLPRRSGNRGYQVTDSVVTDIDLISWWVRRAQRDPAGTDEHLSAALDLVRGRPFADVDWAWALLNGLEADAAALVCDVATVLGNWRLDEDDPSGALIAAQQARKAAPHSEQLARLRMRAHHRRGDLDRVRAVMTELRAAVDADMGPDGDDQLHPDTVALYRQLTSRPAAVRGR